MEENQIQIGAVAQFPAAQLAVPHHRKTAAFTVSKVLRLAVAGYHLHPRTVDNRVDDRFRQRVK